VSPGLECLAVTLGCVSPLGQLSVWFHDTCNYRMDLTRVSLQLHSLLAQTGSTSQLPFDLHDDPSQAHWNAQQHSDEFVMDLLVSLDKLSLLVQELLVIEV